VIKKLIPRYIFSKGFPVTGLKSNHWCVERTKTKWESYLVWIVGS